MRINLTSDTTCCFQVWDLLFIRQVTTTIHDNLKMDFQSEELLLSKCQESRILLLHEIFCIESVSSFRVGRKILKSRVHLIVKNVIKWFLFDWEVHLANWFNTEVKWLCFFNCH